MAEHPYDETQKKNQPLSRNLFARVEEDILTGKLASGSKLSEKKICDEYDVSRTPVRETMMRLEAEGLVETIPNRGAFVSGLSGRDVSDLGDMKNSMEILAIRWAIQRITDEELEQLSETYDYMVFYTRTNDLAKMMEINMNFHRIIHAATHDRILQYMLDRFQRYSRYTQPEIYSGGYLGEVLEEHKAIYQAFITHDPEAGVLAMRQHNRNTGRRIADIHLQNARTEQ